MTLFFSIQRLQLPRTLVKLLAGCNATVLLINLFVGLLVYQNPFLPLTEIKNVFYILAAGTCLAIGLFSLYQIVLFAENIRHNKWHLHKTGTVASLVLLSAALTLLFTIA